MRRLHPWSLLDQLYDFHFRAPMKNAVLYLVDGSVCLAYLLINVLVLGREETRARYEAMSLCALMIVVVPLIYCLLASPKK
jgi:hypothetical protein